MNIDFKLPELGENIHSGDVVNVLVHEGDQIAANDGVFELETDKAVVEIPCPYAGHVAKLHVKQGDTIKVGQVVLTITSGEEAKPAAAPVQAEPAATAPIQKTPPAAAPAPPPVAPATPAEPPQAAAPVAPVTKPQPASPAPVSADHTAPIPAGPAVRRMAREQGIDLSTIAGSGKYGRVLPEDLAAGNVGRASASVSEETASAEVHPSITAGVARRVGQRRLGPRPRGEDLPHPPHDR